MSTPIKVERADAKFGEVILVHASIKIKDSVVEIPGNLKKSPSVLEALAKGWIKIVEGSLEDDVKHVVEVEQPVKAEEEKPAEKATKATKTKASKQAEEPQPEAVTTPAVEESKPQE